MKKNEIHATKELTITQKNIFLWLNDYSRRHKIIDLRYIDIAKATSIDRMCVVRNMQLLEQKGFIKIIKHWKKDLQDSEKLKGKGRKRNSYEILR